MFSSNFLSGANPLSAVSSAVNKFSLFGDEAAEEEAASSSLSSSEEEEEGAKKQKLPQQRGGKASAPGRAPQQQAGRPSPQQGPPKQGRGSPQQRGPPPQASVKPAPQKQGSPGPQSQSLPKSGGQPPQGPAKGGPQPQGPIKPGPGAQSVRPPTQGPGNAAAPRSQGPKSLCPLCKTTELNTHTKEQPNYSTCTQCKSVVCSLCGFSPPDSTVKEWLCLNCQMQRALGGMDPVGPPMVKPQPQSAKQAPTPGPLQMKQGPGQASAPSSPQTKKAPGHDSVPSSPQTKKGPGQDSVPSSPQAKKAPGQDSAPSSPQTKKAPLVEQTSKPGTDKPTEGRKPSQLTKQESISDAGQSAYPQTVQRGPASPAHGQAKSGEPEVEKAIQGTPTKQPPGQPTTQQAPSGSPKLDPKTGRPLQDLGKPQQQMPKGGMGPPSAKSTPAPQVQPPKQESSFFGLSFGGLTEATKPQSTDPQSAAESVTGKLFGFGGFTEPPKPQPAGPQPAAESVTGKLFGFGGLAEVAKPQPSAPQQGAESVTGKLFGFAGLTEAPKPQASAPQPADSVSGKMFGFGSSIFSSASNLITSAVQDENPAQTSPKTPGSPQQGKGAPSQKKKPVSEKPEKPTNEPPKGLETSALSSKVSRSNCPLCKVELNTGSKDPPNYNTCTECKNTVCNLCGFNPMPHLRENEWLCLNCQTQRALAGQLGDMGTDPTPGAPPSKAAGQQPTAQGPKSQNTPARDTTQAAASVTMETVPTKPEQKMEARAERAPATTSSKLATPHEAAASTTHSISCPGIAPAAASSEAIPAPLEKGAAPQPAPPSADITVAPEPTVSSDVAARQDKTTGPALNSRPTKESDASDIDHTSVPLGISVDSPESQAACLDSTRTSESAFSLPKPTIPCEVADVPPQPPSLDQPARFEFVTQSESDVAPPVDSTDGLKTVIETSEAIPAISASTEVDVVLQEVSGSSEAGTDRVTSHEPTTAFEDTIVSPTKADHVPPESEGSPPQVIIPSPEVATVSKDSPPLEMTTPMKSDALLSESVVAPDDSIPASLTHSTEAVSVPLQISPPEFIIPSSQDFTAADSPKPENVVSRIHAEAEFEQAAPKGDTSFGPTPFFEASTAPTKSAAVLLEPVATPVDDFAPPEHTPPAEATSTLAESGAVLEAVAVHQDNVASPEHAPHPEATAAPTESVLRGLMATTEVETINSCGIVSSSEEPEVVPPEPPEPTVVPEGTTALPPTLLTEVIIPHPQPEAVPLETVATTLRSTSSSEAVSALLAPEASPQPASPTEIVAAHSELTLPPEAVVAPVELDAVNLKTTVSPEKPSFTEIMSPNEVVRADEIAPPDTATPPLVKARSTIPEHVAGHPQSVIIASPPAMALLRMKTTEETEEEIIQTGVKGELRKCAPLSEVVTAASPQSEAAPQQLPTPAPEKIAETPPEPVTAPSQTDSTTSLPAKGLPRMKTVQALEEELIHEVAKVEEKKSSVELKLLEEKVESDSSGSSQKCLQDITDHSCISGSLSEGPTMKKELLKEQAPNAISTLETCPPPLELAKSESREEMQTSTDICDINNLEKDVHRPKTLPISSESHHKDDKVPGEVPTKKRPPSINFPKVQLYHSEEDGQEKEPSLPLQGKSKVDTDHHHDILHSGDGEEFTHEGVGGCIRQQKPRQDESKAGSTLEQSKWIFKKGAMADEDDLHEHNTMAGIKEEDISGGGNIRDFKIDMESTTTAPYKMLGRTQASTEGELEMESLTNSPEDRSRGEGSSSLHGSSFTPGTSPTSLSSMDEDSDSSPSNKRLGEESKQRKARHRQHGHVLPTIEDSSEEEELREEEELLREQDMQREVDEQHQVKRSSSRKSKMGKEELRAQWRREHPITPPSNLSPIEDASPTEELRQAVEMEELHKSSANSPSVECESGRSETVAEELLVFQKICEPPVSVSFYSPPDEKHPVEMKDMDKKTMDSLQESNKVLVQEPVKRLRTADEAYEDIMKKRNELLKQKEVEQSQLVNETPPQRTVVPAVTETCYVIISSGDTAQLEKGNNIIERTIVANEEEIKQERTGPIPGTTQTQATVFLHDSPEVKEIPSGDGVEDKATTVMTVSSKEHEPESIASSDFPLTRAFHSIPDLKITQCSSGEEDGEEELVVSPDIPQTRQTAFKMENVPMASDTPTITPVIGTVEMEPELVICETPQPKTIQTRPSASVLVPVPVSAETEPISVVCEVPQPRTISALPEAQNLHAASAPVVSSAPPSDATQVVTASEMEPVSTICVTSGTMTSPAIPACSPTSVLTSAGTEPISVICEVPKPAAHISTPAEASLHPDPAPASILALNEITVVCEIPQAKSTTALASMTESVPAPPAPISESAPVGIQALSPAPVSHPDPVPVPVTLLETVPAPSLTRAFEPVFPVDIAQTQASLICPISQAQSLPVTIKLPLTTQLQSVVVGVQHSVDYSTLSRTSLIENPPVSPHLDNVSTVLSPAILSGQEHMLTSVPSTDNIPLKSHSTKYEAVNSVGITAPCITAVATSRVSSAVSAAPSSVLSPMPTTVATASPLPAVPQYIQHHSTLPSVTSDTVLMHPPLTPVPVPDPYCTTLLSGSSHEKLGILFTAPAPSIPPTPLPPPTQSQPSVCPKDIAPASTICVTPSLGPVPVSTAVTMAHSTATTTVPSTLGQTCRSQVLPTVSLCYQPEDTVPSLSSKPVVIQPTTGNQNIENGQLTAVAPQSVEAMTLNLITPSECKISATSPKSPLSPRLGSSLHETYVVITLPSEPGSPSESIVTQASTSQSMIGLSKPLDTTAPLAITQYTKSIESQEIWGPHTVVSNTSHVYSSLSTSGQSTAMPNLFTKVLATEVQRTTLSVVCERVLPASAPSTATGTTSIPQETTTKVQLKPKENGKVHYPGDVVDLRTLKLSVAMTEKGMDLSSPDSRRQSFSSDSSGRQTSAVQSSIVNLSSETPASTLSFVTDSITIVTCTATIASNGAGERPLTKGPSISTPLQLTTSKIFEPVAQIIYRPVDSKPINSSSADAPINLSFGAVPSTQAPKSSVSDSPACMTNGTNGFSTRPEARVMGAVDLTTTKPVQMVTSINESTSQVITSIAEEDGKPVDLTGGRRAVCCDVVYKLPFAGICKAPQPATTLPEDRFGYRDDHYQYGRAGLNGTKVVSGLKPSMSDTNLAEAGLFFYKSRNGYDYHNGATEGAVDLTSGKMSKGEVTFYSTGGAGLFSGMNISVYSKTSPAAEAHFGINSILKYSDGAVSSSVAAPVPSTYAITTQPASIFNSGYKDFSGVDSSGIMQSIQTLQNQLHSQPCHFLSMSAAEEDLHMKTGMSKEALSSPFPAVVPTVTAIPGAYIDGSFETIAAPLQALPASVLFAPEGSKDQQYQMERELLELEKVKQLRMAEEIEWERQEIQRFREQEQLIVQQELEKLQTMKQQLLHQQEEERQAHLIMQQETYAQHQLQLEQIHQLQQQLQLHLEEQKMRQIYGYDLSEAVPPLSSSQQISQEQQYLGCDNSQFWPVQDDTAMTSVFTGFDLPQKQSWLPASTQSVTPNTPSVPASELSGKESKGQEYLQLSNQVQSVSGQHDGQKKINSGVQTDGEDIMDRAYAGRRRRSRKSVDSSVQTDDEDQDGWDVPARSRRRSRSSRYVDGEKGKQASKLPSIAIQTVAEISVQTDPSGSLKRPSVRAHVDTKVELSSPEKPHRGGSFSSERKSPQRDKKRPTPLEISYTTHLKADSPSLQVASSPPKSPKVLHSPISPLSPRKALEYVPYEKSIRDSSPQKITDVEPSKAPLKSPRAAKGVQRPTLESKTLSVTGDEQAGSNLPYSDGYLGKTSQSSTPSGTQKKVKRTLPNPPQEEEAAGSQASYSTSSARRRLCRNTTMARVKILQDIDRELDLVERESSKLRQKQAELDEEEKEIDARLRYLEMGINRRRDALLKEREKRERDYLQGVAEERDYMSDSEVNNIREKRGDSHGLERPKTAPQSELNKFIPPQTQPTSQYTQYQYAAPTKAPPQTLYQQSSFYECQQTSPYQSIYSSVPTPSYPQSSHQHSQPRGYQHTSQTQLMHQKPRQAALSDLEPKITTNYEVIRNQAAMIGPSSADTTYGVSHLGGKYSNLNLRMGLDERGSVASSPMSSISADSLYADVDHHTPKNYLLFNDMSEIAKGSTALSSTFSIPDKDIAKADRLLRAAEMRDYLGPLQASLRLHPCMKVQEDAMEEPYELKLLKQQIKQEFRRGADGLDPLAGLHHCYPSDSNYRHFHKAEKYSIGRLTLEKQAAKQLPASVLYQKQAKHRKSLIDPKITKFSPIQESRDLGLDYSSYLTPSTPQVSGFASRARLLQDDITFGLRKSITEQQKYLGSTLASNIAQSLHLGQSLNLNQHLRSSLQDDTTYPSGSRSRPASRPSSVYGLDLSIKRDLSNSSLRLRMESDGTSLLRTKPTNLPISQSRGRIPIVAQNSEEESPLSPVGQPMGMARASAGPLPPISADLRDQFGSSHSLPEVQQHMREESRARAYDRDIAFLMDDMQGVMPDSEAYHLRQEETGWFDKPRETYGAGGLLLDRKQVSHKQMRQHGEIKPSLYPFPHTRVKIQRDPKDRSVSGNGLGLRVLGGKEIPGNTREIGAYVACVVPGGTAEQTGKIVEGMQILEWNGVALTGKTYEEVQGIVTQPCGEAEICVRLDLNMLSDPDHPQCLELQDQSKPGPAGDRQKSPGVDPNQLATELQKVSQQQAPSAVASGLQEKGLHVHSSATPAASSAVHSPGHPGSPSVNKKRQSSKPGEAAKTKSHPITGDIQLQLNYDRNVGNLIVHVLQARNLAPRDNNGYSDPFVKVYLLPGRSAENKRRSKSSQRSLNPEWNQTVIYKNIHLEQLKKKTLEVTVWDYDRSSSNDFLGEVLIDLSNTAQLDNLPHWFPLKEQSEVLDHGRPRSVQGLPQPPKPSVIKSRSHGVFPDPSKDMQLPTIEKSHSSPGSSKSSSETHLRSHGPSRSQSKGSVTQTHLEDAGVAIAAAEAAVQQQRYQPTRPGHRPTEASVKTVSAVTNLNLEEEGGADAVDSAIFQVPQIGKAIPNGTDKIRGLDLGDNQGKTQVMGEIKIALKKETKTEGEQLIVEILQCRNITYKFKSPDHLPDLYVKLYVVNVATQKKLIKKKTRVCRHDREPSFNETFRFTLNPTGHSLQLFLVSNGGKFVKKTLVGEAYVWLDKVDLRKRTTSWHKLLASSPQSHP